MESYHGLVIQNERHWESFDIKWYEISANTNWRTQSYYKWLGQLSQKQAPPEHTRQHLEYTKWITWGKEKLD